MATSPAKTRLPVLEERFLFVYLYMGEHYCPRNKIAKFKFGSLNAVYSTCYFKFVIFHVLLSPNFPTIR